MIGDPFIDISVVLKPGHLYKIELPANVSAYYCTEKVGGSGTSNVFVAVEGVNTIRLTSPSNLTGTFDLVELLPSYYDLYDGLGGTFAYPKQLDRFSSKYSFRPDWMSMVGNRLVSFKKGRIYLHDGDHNEFYGEREDTVLAGILSEAENKVKVFNNAAIEGDQPDRIHFRTEKPNVQSSDVTSSDMRVREGVCYAPVLRDRLSPNVSGTYSQKVFTGDRMRGETCRFMVIYSEPIAPKSFKFVNIGFIPSTGQTV